MTPTTPTPPPEDTLRPHAYDGIQEYDKRLPNWWLYTLYVMVLFWIGYWAYFEWFRIGMSGPERIERALARIEADRFANATVMNDPTLWQMSRAPAVVEAGRKTFDSNCVACHLASLRGKSENPAAIGPDLTDQRWIHGGHPTEILKTVNDGIPPKGMPTWGPVLGAKKIGEVVAYILSKHQEGEPILPDSGTTSPPVAAAK